MAKKTPITPGEGPKIMMLQGGILEIGQQLTNLFGMNPELQIIQQFVTTGFRPLPAQSHIIMAGNQAPQYEQITVIYLVYENPGELNGLVYQQVNDKPVKATLKN